MGRKDTTASPCAPALGHMPDAGARTGADNLMTEGGVFSEFSAGVRCFLPRTLYLRARRRGWSLGRSMCRTEVV